MINSGFFGNNQKWWMSRVFFMFLSIFYRFSSFFDSFYSFSSVSLENDKKIDLKKNKKLINSGLFGKKQKWWMSRSFFNVIIFLSFFYRFFIDFLSFFYHFRRKQRKMNKNYQKMMKNDKKLKKKWKKLETFTIFDCFRRSQNLSIFYRFFSPRKQRKMNKNYQKMMKNDKILIKKMKKTRDIHHFWLFPKRPEFINFLSIFFLQGNRGKWIKTIKKWWKMIKYW